MDDRHPADSENDIVAWSEVFETVSNHFCPDVRSTNIFKELNDVSGTCTYYGSSKNQIALSGNKTMSTSGKGLNNGVHH